ncbi:hypothetical protein [Nitrosomonas sp.]|uniref:hypothetical protein n=1 Tax=Nitrosomonas sp. TaxID=42353 RepID=UPI001D1B9359|nr:hypothetical protein [Nitrosomonas sp.]MCB1948543.1 hypothetical protein [Nitrosomonas sp.]MCP5241918.1 hypothetical protein [Burkholderiales bacterium]MDR4513251.1 hypothetical protein [Nitrosomonas sp.]
MLRSNNKHINLSVLSAIMLGAFSTSSLATATFDPATGIVDMPVVEVLNGASSEFYSAQLQISGDGLQIIAAQSIPAAKGQQRVVFDSATTSVHVPSVVVGANDFYAKLKLVPGSNPLRFTVDQLVSNSFQGCPSFSSPGPAEGSCVLSGEYNQDITLTKNIQWIVSSGVYIGGDNVNSATLTINPGTKIFGQQGADYLWIRRGSKIMAEGTPDNPIVMSGALQQSAGEWGGLVISGNAPVNGCNEGVSPCEVPFEAVTSELFGGNNPNDNSGLVKYTQILFAGFAVRPNEELNGLTLNGVGAATKLEFIQVHQGLDDGVEMFGGTAQMKYMVLTNNGDDSLDWGSGWTGKAQFVLIKQASDDGDRGIEADNNEVNNDIEPRAKPMLSNMTIIGGSAGTQGILLRRGTGANIWNTVITGFQNCISIDGEATFLNAGAPGNLSGELTINNSFVHGCGTDFLDGPGATFATADWFTSQSGNSLEDPLLNGYLPAAGSPLPLSGAPVNDAFFDTVDYVGAFKDADDDWTDEWTFNF